MTLAYDRSGSGPPLVLLHGIGGRRGVWDPLVPILSREREVIVPDLPGFGESPALPRGVERNTGALAQAVEDLIAELGLERPHVAGNSMGGAVAIEIARRGSARSVAALSPAGLATRAELRYIEATLVVQLGVSRLLAPVAGPLFRPAIVRVALLGIFFGRPQARAPEAAAADLRALAGSRGFFGTMRALHKGRLAEGAEPGVPVTIAWGQRDRLLWPRQAERARTAFPKGRHLKLPRCGHVPMSDDPELVARVLLEASAEPR